MDEHKDLISVIIPAHNEEKYIAKCLESIKKQDYPNVEITVVCNACKDNTAKIARSYTKKVIVMDIANVSLARNLGAKNAKGKILAFIDADSIMESGLLTKVGYYVNKGYVGGAVAAKPIEDIFVAKLWWFIGSRIFNYFYLTPSGFLFARKDMFSGYNPKQTLGEDTLVLNQLRKKGKVKYISEKCIYTSSRRYIKDGYFKTAIKQTFGFLLRKNYKYEPVR
jgi:glycosyltransferase involved in cell wall biosynthesis